MAKIMQFRGRNTKSSSRDDNIHYMDRIKGHRVTILYRSVLGVVLALVVCLALYIQWKHKTYLDCIVVSSTENSMIQSNHIVNYNGKVLSYGKDGASCVDIKGNAVWNVTYEMQNPMIDVNGSMVAIGDYNARTIYLMNEKGSVGEITTTMPIYQFCVSQNGVLAVELNDSNVTWIYLYDSNGNPLAYFKTSMQKSGFPIDITISPNGQMVGVSYLYVAGGEMKTSIAFYNFGGVGQNETDNYVSGYDYRGLVVPCIKFIDSNTAFALSDDRLMLYNGNQKPTSTAEHLIAEEVLSVYYSDKYIGLVFVSDSTDNRYRFEVYDEKGNLVNSRDFNIAYKNISFNGDYVYIYNEQECLIYNLDGTLKFDGNLGKTAYLLIPSDSVSKMSIVGDSSIDNIELK